MQTTFGTDDVEWGPLAASATTHGALRHPDWELGSSSRGSSERSGSSSSGSNATSKKSGDGEFRERIDRLLAAWEKKTTQVILKWGSMGVKSTEYTRILRRQAIEKRQKAEMQRQMRKIKQENRNEQRRREERIRMAENAWARRRAAAGSNKDDKNNGGEAKQTALSREPRPPPTARSDPEMKRGVAIRRRQLLPERQPSKVPCTAPIAHVPDEEMAIAAEVPHALDISAIEVEKTSSVGSTNMLETCEEKVDANDPCGSPTAPDTMDRSVGRDPESPHAEKKKEKEEEEEEKEEEEKEKEEEEKEKEEEEEEVLSRLAASEYEAPTTQPTSPILDLPRIVATEEEPELVRALAAAAEVEQVIGGFEDDSFGLSGIVVKDVVTQSEPLRGDAAAHPISPSSSGSRKSASSSEDKPEDGELESRAESTQSEVEAQEAVEDANYADVFESGTATSSIKEAEDAVYMSKTHSAIGDSDSRPDVVDTTESVHDNNEAAVDGASSSSHSVVNSSASTKHDLTVRTESGANDDYEDDFEVTASVMTDV
ncbi:hypothetical protein DQ04_03921040 [Trypanosoma grayi]|uniref:hypothetical protein n=1 Tax=Trypanosoma grayi TaxID=71804 RepID=UPI0004F3FCF9|nr:hypothetical protein DQ04_03921040 [Trypanosoma grayi]KEG10294.1 hypothetical protein DQ04_03921040 [Trypanosoma grayi]